MPLVALTTTYVCFDAIILERLEPTGRVDELPSEVPCPAKRSARAT
jgi:hypothetical protein